MEYPTTDLIRKIRNFRNPKTDPIREYSKYLGTGIRSDPKNYQILEIRKPIRSDFFLNLGIRNPKSDPILKYLKILDPKTDPIPNY